eukprot:3319909-Rhodomonas_salina.1
MVEEERRAGRSAGETPKPKASTAGACSRHTSASADSRAGFDMAMRAMRRGERGAADSVRGGFREAVALDVPSKQIASKRVTCITRQRGPPAYPQEKGDKHEA